MAAGAARCGGGRGSEGLSAWLALLRHTLAPKKDPTRDARVLGFAGCKIKDSNTRRSTQQVPGLDVGSEVLIVGSMPQETAVKLCFHMCKPLLVYYCQPGAAIRHGYASWIPVKV